MAEVLYTPEELQKFKAMLQAVVAEGQAGGYYTSKWTGEEIDNLLNSLPVSSCNLLDNWYFGPGVICQCGNTSATSNTNGKLVDRWNIALFYTGSSSITDDGLHIVPGIYDGQPYAWLEQKTEASEARRLIPGQDMRLTVLLSDGNLISGHGVVPVNWIDGTVSPFPQRSIHFQVDINTGNIQIITFMTFIWDTIGYLTTRFSFKNEITIRAIKLEYSAEQTLARQDISGNWGLSDPPPNPALELEKCQRYQVNLLQAPNIYGTLGVGVAHTASSANIFVPLPVSLRAGPTIRNSGKFVLRNVKSAGSSEVVTSFGVPNYTRSGISFDANVGNASLIAGNAYALWFVPTRDGHFIVDANL